MGKPCIKCGSEERNTRGDCAACSRAGSKAWYEQHKAKAAAYKRDWLAQHPEQAQLFDLRVRVKKYGLTVEQYREMFARQEGRCCICRQPLGRIDIDHDHATGRVRGLLCHACNIGLGAFQDDPRILQRAIEYLKKNKTHEAGDGCTTTC